jgi:hypothetical protein
MREKAFVEIVLIVWSFKARLGLWNRLRWTWGLLRDEYATMLYLDAGPLTVSLSYWKD